MIETTCTVSRRWSPVYSFYYKPNCLNQTDTLCLRWSSVWPLTDSKWNKPGFTVSPLSHRSKHNVYQLLCNAADHQYNHLLTQLINKFYYVTADHQSATSYLSSQRATSHQVLYPYQFIPSFTWVYQSLWNSSSRVSEDFCCILLDIRSLSHSSLALLSLPLSLGVLHPLYWWYTGQCGLGSTFSGCALESFLPLTFSEPLTSLASAPSCFHFSCAVMENRGGGGETNCL